MIQDRIRRTLDQMERTEVLLIDFKIEQVQAFQRKWRAEEGG